MPELIYSEGFVEDVARIKLSGKRKEVLDLVDLLADFPELGSKNLPASIIDHYGGNVRKLSVKPFLVIYEYCECDDAVYLLGIDHQRASW